MNPALLDRLTEVGAAFDTETWKLTESCKAPPIVCASIATKDGAHLLDVEQARRTFLELLKPGVVIIGAYLTFDMIVMGMDFARRGIDIWPEIFAKYDRDEVFDIQLCEALDAIAGGHLGYDRRTGRKLFDPAKNKATGRYSLAVCLDQVMNRRDAKRNDRWQTRYYLLRNVPISEWPVDARQYPVDDVENPREIALAQAGLIPRGDGTIRRAANIHMLGEMCRASFALGLGAAWGFGTDPERIDALEAETLKNIAAGAQPFFDAGLIVEDRGGKLEVELVDPKTKQLRLYKLKKPRAPLIKLVAAAYGAEAPCGKCDGEGRGPFGKDGNEINCPHCAASGFDLDAAPAVPRTDKDGVSCERDILADSGDDLITEFADWGEDLKTVSTYLPALRAGFPMFPNLPLANERVSYEGGIVQTMPRKPSAHGDISVRECVTAKPDDWLIASVDFSTVELATWAQACIWIPEVGFSTLADAINNDKDPHCILGADLCGMTYEDFIVPAKRKKEKWAVDYRQAAKPGNFGYPGGMGVPKFVLTQRRAPGLTTKGPDGRIYKGIRFCLLIGKRPACGEEKVIEWAGRALDSPTCVACLEEAAKIRQAWFNRWDEAQPYFKFIGEQVERVGSITHFGSNIVRGGVEFCQAANGYFSALAAYGAKRALWAVSRECFTDKRSALYGCRPVGFIHDEIVAAMPPDRASDAAHRMAELMVDVMQACVPDVKIKAEPALARRLYKGAEPVYDKPEGDPTRKLIPWEPVAEAA